MFGYMLLEAAVISFVVTLIVVNVAEKLGGGMSFRAMAVVFVALTAGLTALLCSL